MAAKPKVPKASAIATAMDWDIFRLRDYCADILEDANDHGTALAIWSVNRGDVDLGCEFLQLGHAIGEAGELTPALRDKQEELLRRFGTLRR